MQLMIFAAGVQHPTVEWRVMGRQKVYILPAVGFRLMNLPHHP